MNFNIDKIVGLVQERIFPNQSHWTACLPKLSLFWRICILPEILGRWYTRKLNIKHQQIRLDGDCYCRLETDEEQSLAPILHVLYQSFIYPACQLRRHPRNGSALIAEISQSLSPKRKLQSNQLQQKKTWHREQ